jgi:hypothetical protein
MRRKARAHSPLAQTLLSPDSWIVRRRQHLASLTLSSATFHEDELAMGVSILCGALHGGIVNTVTIPIFWNSSPCAGILQDWHDIYEVSEHSLKPFSRMARHTLLTQTLKDVPYFT